MSGNGARNRTVLPYARIAWDGDAPRSIDIGDVFFSGAGDEETRHVFLGGTDLSARFANAQRGFVVGELGLGAGLNMLSAWDLWRNTPKREGAHLHLMSVERAPFAPEDFARAHRAWPALSALSGRLRAAMPPPAPGLHRVRLDRDVTLTLILGEASAILPQVEAAVDAWFLDGFAPAKNPDLWSASIFAEIARLSAPDAVFATYTVAGGVRRGLETAGFVVEKQAGYGRKREMLTGRLVRPDGRRVRAPWFDCVRERRRIAGPELVSDPPLGPPFQGGECSGLGAVPPLEKGGLGGDPTQAHKPDQTAKLAATEPKTIAIIGAGIAGASLAEAARRARLQPTLFDPGGPGAGASGNPAGLVMPRLDLGDTPAARFFLDAFLYTERLLRGLGEGVFKACGVRLSAVDAADRERLARIGAARLLPEDWLRDEGGALYSPRAGVVDPRGFVKSLVGDTQVVRAGVRRLMREQEGLRLDTDQGVSEPFDCVVLANSVEAVRFVEARCLPLSAVAGQLDWFEGATPPTHAFAFGPYLAPCPAGGLVIGATYDRIARGAAPRTSLDATRRNIDAIAALAPDIAAELDPALSQPRAALRCQTPDRLPVAGPLPDLGFYAGEYDGLRTGLKRNFPRGEAVGEVYILSGLGSRGLVTAPLLAEMIIAEIAGAPSPVAAEIAEILHPARFFIRDLKRANGRSPRPAE